MSLKDSNSAHLLEYGEFGGPQRRVVTEVKAEQTERRQSMREFTESVMVAAEDMRRQLTDKAAEDPAFRDKLLSDPKAAIRQEFGIEVPDHIEIRVHQNDIHTLHLALPAGPNLDEDQLETVAAGLCCCL